MREKGTTPGRRGARGHLISPRESETKTLKSRPVLWSSIRTYNDRATGSAEGTRTTPAYTNTQHPVHTSTSLSPARKAKKTRPSQLLQLKNRPAGLPNPRIRPFF